MTICEEVQSASTAKWAETPYRGPPELEYAMKTASHAAFIAGALWALKREASKLERKIEDAEQTLADRMSQEDPETLPLNLRAH